MADSGDALVLPMGVSGAEFDGHYRYRLWRVWDEEADQIGWVMLNPSIAGASHDDPTIRRCLGFARRWGFGSIDIVNLYAFRATRPKMVLAAIKKYGEPYAIGPRADENIVSACGRCKTMIVAWGTQNFALERAEAVASLLRAHHPNVLCLGRTEGGQPRHPLYLPNNTVPEIFS
jgi:hypothetical protein